MESIKNSLFVFALFLVLAMSMSVFGASDILPGPGNMIADKYIEISMVNQEPDPVEPGKYVLVKFKIVNYGSKDTGRVTVSMEENFPFTLVAGEKKSKDIGILESRQYGDKSEIIEWKLLVDKNAPEGENNLTLYFTESSEQGVFLYEDAFAVTVRTSDTVIQVAEVTTTPLIVEPGQQAVVRVTLRNLADNFLKDVKVSMDLTAFDIATIGTNQKIIQRIDAKSQAVLEFTLLPDADIDISAKKIPLTISYKDNLNTAYSQNSTFGLVIDSPIEYLLSIEDTEIIKPGQAGEVNLRISNKGVSDIKFLSITLIPSEQYDTLSSPEIYVGKVDSDDYEGLTYRIFAKQADQQDKVTLRLYVEYKDAYNKGYKSEEEVVLQLYSGKKAEQYGLVKKKGASGIIVVIIILAAVAGFIWYRRKRKK